MNEDIELTRLWLNYVKANIDILESAVKKAQENMSYVREYMATIGSELTPAELNNFTTLLKETIEYIRLTEES